MKKAILSGAALLLGLCANAQNVQLHYDFGHSIYDELDGRPKLTTTVENFTPDKWGSTFFFIDMDYARDGIRSAYWEISRELKFWQAPVSIHLEYNGGLSTSFTFGHDALIGATYTYNNPSFTRGFTITPMYKHLGAHDFHTYQITGTWYMHFLDGLLTFNGFLDLWGFPQENPIGGPVLKEGDKLVFLSEPQFWINLNRIKGIDKDFNLSIGTEMEISRNFARMDKFSCIPTLAIKWTFN